MTTANLGAFARFVLDPTAPRPVGPCRCGCGELVTGASARRYVNKTHARRAQQRRRRAQSMGPPGPRLEVCACGCGTPLSGTRRRQFVSTAHRMRAARRRATLRSPAA